MSGNLSKRLHRLSTMDPLEDINSVPEKSKVSAPKRTKVSKSSYDDFISEIDKGLSKISSSTKLGEDFDDFLDNLDYSDEDVDLKNSLLSMGKKYNREHFIDDPDTRNAIDKAFEPQERELKELKNGIASDIKEIDEMIFKMKASRGASYKTMTDMMENRNSARNTLLNAIKASNDIQKAKFDIANKQKKTDDTSNDAVASANLAVQQLLQQGHTNLLESVGGRESVSGAFYDEDDDPYDALMSDTFSIDDVNAERMLDEEEPSVDEGSLFIKYENEFDHYELGVRDDGSYEGVRAIDKEGDVIPDYPVPTGLDDLRFKIDKESNIASDQLNRRYQLKYVDQEDYDTII